MSAPIPWKHIRNVLVLFAPLWLGATMLFGAVGLCYSLFKKDQYIARLPLVMRDEAARSVDRLGRFPSQTELKAAQKTILEMTKNPEVVRAALEQIGPPDGRHDPEYPTATQIDSICESNVNLVAPEGAEFGSSEVVYLQVKAADRDRATSFCLAVFDNLTQHLRNVRRVQADSMISELQHGRDMAKQALDESAVRLSEIEVQFGTDLGDLRSLNETLTGDSTGRRTLETTLTELQAAQLELQKLESLVSLLDAGTKDPQQLLISGEDLLSSQPSLQRLKIGLMDAQIRSSELSGVYTFNNPKRRAAIAVETEIRARMQKEAASIVQGMAPRIKLQSEKVSQLSVKSQQLAERLEKIALVRANYGKINSEYKHRTDTLAQAESQLAEAHAARSAALSTNLIAELGKPQASDKPLGPGTIVLAGGSTFAGMIFGLGAVFLIAPGPTETHGRRRWSDYLQGRGRRMSDQGAAGTPAATPPDGAQPGAERRQRSQPPVG